MAALFALHDWTPSVATELRRLLLALVEQTRQTNQVLIDVAQQGARTRTFRRADALVEAVVKAPVFSIGAYADLTDEYREHSRVLAELNYLSMNRILSFYCEYTSTRELAIAVRATNVLNGLSTAYGYVCDTQNIRGPNYYALGKKLFTIEDSFSDILNDRSATGKWEAIIDSPERPYLEGKFRDLYPENVIGRKHVNELRRLGLVDDRESGVSVNELGPDLYWMSVAPGALQRTQSRLNQAGLILIPGSYYDTQRPTH